MEKKDYSLKRIVQERPILSSFIGFALLGVMPLPMLVIFLYVTLTLAFISLLEKVLWPERKKEAPESCSNVKGVVKVEEITEEFLLKQSILVTQNEVKVYAREIFKWNPDAAGVLKGLFDSLDRLYSFLEANPDRYIETYNVYKDIQIVINNIKPVVEVHCSAKGYIGKEGLDRVTAKLKEVVGNKVDLIVRRTDALFGAEAEEVIKAIDEMEEALAALGTGTDSKTRN